MQTSQNRRNRQQGGTFSAAFWTLISIAGIKVRQRAQLLKKFTISNILFRQMSEKKNLAAALFYVHTKKGVSLSLCNDFRPLVQSRVFSPRQENVTGKDSHHRRGRSTRSCNAQIRQKSRGKILRKLTLGHKSDEQNMTVQI